MFGFIWYHAADPDNVRLALFKLFITWKSLLPDDTLTKIDRIIAVVPMHHDASEQAAAAAAAAMLPITLHDGPTVAEQQPAASSSAQSHGTNRKSKIIAPRRIRTDS